MRPTTLTLTLILVLSGLAAALTPAAAAGGEAPINAMCPVMPDQPSDPRFTVEFEGKTVGFCCLKCRKMFREDPTPYLARLPGFEDRVVPATVPDEPTGLARAVRFAGRFHPLLVHFPIALLIAAGLAEILRVGMKRPALEAAAGFSLALGAAGAVVAAAVGWAQAAHGNWPAAEDTLELHRWTGTAVAVLAVGAVMLRRRWRFLYLACLLLAAGLVGVAGHLGGTLVFGPDHFRW